MKIHWNNIEFEIDADRNYPHEASSLKLDCSKALTQLHWHPVWTDTMAFKLTAEWYKTYYTESKILSLEQLEHYIHDAKSQKLPWSLS
jgi:CDP-glucose 4,6-dehydratase